MTNPARRVFLKLAAVLKFEGRILKEISLSVGTVTIGRQPENVLRIDNPAVSGHHAKIYSEGNHYVLEDRTSFNGTYVNKQRISKIVLKEGDKAVIGKHTIEFQDPQSQAVSRPIDILQARLKAQRLERRSLIARSSWILQKPKRGSRLQLPRLLAPAVEKTQIGNGQAAASTVHNAHQTVGTLTILKGRTDQRYYVLSSQLTVIGKSRMAGIRLHRWFAPRVIASIYRTEDNYFLAPARDDVKIKVNGTLLKGISRRQSGYYRSRLDCC